MMNLTKSMLMSAAVISGCGSFRDMKPTEGESGVNCYEDLGDYNNDGAIDSLDCLGSNGQDGEAGSDGLNGKVGSDGVDGANGQDGASGQDGIDGTDGKDYIPPTSLSGFYTFPNGGYLELIENADGEVIIYGTQRLYSVNFDLGLALHPNLPQGPHNTHSGIISGEYNGNYSSSTHDVEVDGASSNISGYQKTYYKILLNSDDRLEVKLLVYSDSGLVVNVNRTLTSD